MPGGIWDAIGAALQKGSQTYSVLKADERDRNDRQRLVADERAYRQQQMQMQQEEMAAAQRERDNRVLSAAIEGINPNGQVDAGLVSQIQAKAPELMGRLNKQSAGTLSPLGGGGVAPGLGGAVMNFADTFTRNPTQKEMFVQEDRSIAANERDKENIFKTHMGSTEHAGESYDQQVQEALANGLNAPPLTSAEFTRREKVRGDQDARVASIRANASSGGSTPNTDALTAAVMANPQLFQQLTPTARVKLTPALQAAGFDFQTPMAEGAKKQMSEANSAVAQAQDLARELPDQADNMGPFKGYAGLLPDTELTQMLFGTRDVKTLQSSIDLVRQRVGKLLEGGVLRKEDEVKYAKIFPTVFNSPELAEAKMKNVIATLEQDVSNYLAQQDLGGRRTAPLQVGAGAVTKPNAGSLQPQAPAKPNASRFQIVSVK